MTTYKINEISKTLDKLFKIGINTNNQILKLEWQDLNDFTPLEKSLIMDFKTAVKNKKIIQFLAGVEYGREG